jgi:hypothetical protein
MSGHMVKAQPGFKFGVNISNFYFTNKNLEPYLGLDIDLRPYFGYDIEWVQLGKQKPLSAPYLSVYYNFKLSDKLGIRPELSFTQNGVSFSQSTYERIKYKVIINYISIPLSVSCRIIHKEHLISHLYIGGYGSVGMKAVKKVAFHNSETDVIRLKNLETIDAGLHLGIDFKIKIWEHSIIAGCRFFQGFNEAFHIMEDQVQLYQNIQKIKNIGFILTLGYEL